MNILKSYNLHDSSNNQLSTKISSSSFLKTGMVIYFMYGFHNSKERLSEDSLSRDFLYRLTAPSRYVRKRARSLSSEDGPLSPSSDSENDEGFLSNLMTSDDESPKQTLINKERKKEEDTRQEQK